MVRLAANYSRPTHPVDPKGQVRAEFIQMAAAWVIENDYRVSDIADLVEVDIYSAVLDIIESHVCEVRHASC